MSTTLAELKTELQTWLHRKAADTAGYEEYLIRTGEKWIFRHARTREMETALNVAVAAGVAAVPADYVELKHAYIDGAPIQMLTRKPSHWVLSNYPIRAASSKPLYIGRDGASFIFGPYPDAGYTLKGYYYKRLGSLIAGVNDLFTNNYDLYLFASLAEAAPFLKKGDADVAIWTNKRNEILRDVNGEQQREQASGGPLVMSLG